MNKTIAFISDIHLDEQYLIDNGINSYKNWELILSDVALKPIDEIIFGGDIGSPSAHEYFFISLNKIPKEIKIILGNHDSYNNVKKYYSNTSLEKNGELYYCSMDKYFKYFFLDSSSDKISFSQLEWLEKELFGNNLKPVIFIHHPILRVNTPVDTEFPLINRNDVKKLLLKCENDVIVFCGHYHMEDKTTVKNINQYISPSAAYQIKKEASKLELITNTFGYRIIHFTDGQIKSENVSFKK